MTCLSDVVLVALVCIGASHASSSFEVFRMLQYEHPNNNNGALGSQKAGFSLVASAIPNPRKATVISWRDLLDADVDTILKDAGAMVVVVHDVEMSHFDLSQWSVLEYKLMHMNITIPVYFSRDSGLLESYDSVSRSESADSWAARFYTADLRLSVDDEVPKLRSFPTLAIEGWLLADDTTRATAPTVAVVAHIDSLSIAPGLSFGADANGSGSAAILELLRAFSKLYAEQRTRGMYNILFLLTTGSSTNFDGTLNWLETRLLQDEHALKSIEFVLCVDSVGRGNDLYLHSSKPKTSAKISKMYQHLSDAASAADKTLRYVHRRINISDPQVYWEHERFSRNRMPAATVSHRETAPRMFERSHLFDTTANVDFDRLFGNVKIIGEAIAKLVYDSAADFEVFEGSTALNRDFLEAWLHAVADHSRFSSQVPPGSELVLNVEQTFKTYATRVRVHAFPGSEETIFAVNTASQLYMHQVKPAMFHLATLCIIIVYLACIYIGVVGVSQTVQDIRGVFWK